MHRSARRRALRKTWIQKAKEHAQKKLWCSVNRTIFCKEWSSFGLILRFEKPAFTFSKDQKLQLLKDFRISGWPVCSLVPLPGAVFLSSWHWPNRLHREENDNHSSAKILIEVPKKFYPATYFLLKYRSRKGYLTIWWSIWFRANHSGTIKPADLSILLLSVCCSSQQYVDTYVQKNNVSLSNHYF